MCEETNGGRIDFLLLLLQQMGDETRARRDPEHLYTAAALGGIGAVAWGVATIGTIQGFAAKAFFLHPAIVGGILCLTMACVVCYKTYREHKVYRDLRKEQIALVALLARETHVTQAQLSVGLREGFVVGNGYRVSMAVVVLPALIAMWFCFSIYWSVTVAPVK